MAKKKNENSKKTQISEICRIFKISNIFEICNNLYKFDRIGQIWSDMLDKSLSRKWRMGIHQIKSETFLFCFASNEGNKTIQKCFYHNLGNIRDFEMFEWKSEILLHILGVFVFFLSAFSDLPRTPRFYKNNKKKQVFFCFMLQKNF